MFAPCNCIFAQSNLIIVTQSSHRQVISAVIIHCSQKSKCIDKRWIEGIASLIIAFSSSV